MARIWDRVFSRKKNDKLLISLQEKARQDPKNCQVQVRLGYLMAKMGNKKAAIEAYRQAAEKFAQRGLIIGATAMSKIVMRLDPLQREIQQKVSRLFAQWEALQEKRVY